MKARNKNVKRMLCAGLTLCMTVGTGMTAMAGTWRHGMAPNENRWWYDYDNGSYAAGGWQWIDGNQDGIAESYYFDESGWMLADTTTPDGYTVNSNGAWVENGQVQTKTAEAQQGSQQNAQQSQNTEEQQGSQNQAAQGTGQYVSGSYGADGTWTDVSYDQQYEDFWGEDYGWMYAISEAPYEGDAVTRTAAALNIWAATERGAAWKAAFDRYEIRRDLYPEDMWSGSGQTVTFTTPAGIGSEARYDVENAVKMMLKMSSDSMAEVTACSTTVNGDGSITVTLSYEMGG